MSSPTVKEAYRRLYRAVRVAWNGSNSAYESDRLLTVSNRPIFRKALISFDNRHMSFSGWRDPYRRAGFSILYKRRGYWPDKARFTDIPF